MSDLTPSSETDAAALVRDARAAGRKLDLRGGGTRSGLGRPAEAEDVLTSAGLTGITLHEPAELVIAARAGTALRDIEAVLAAHGQRLPFEPMDHRRLYGSTGEPTIGGVVAGNHSGPRRVAAGAARDHLIGLRLVNGLGEAIKSGGRVMKNVTGLDLARLVCGAHGTLGLVTEATFKLLPVAETTATLVFDGLDDRAAVAALCAALGSPFEATGAAHLPAGPGGARAQTCIRLEGFSPSVDYRFDRLAELLLDYGTPSRFEGPMAEALWRDIRDAALLAEPRERAIWRLSVAPTRGPQVLARIAKGIVEAHFYDWGGGLLWLAVAAAGDAGAGAIRAALSGTGGHATLVRAPAAIRRAVPVFEPLSPALMKLTARIKASFDPDGIFNAGRMYAGV